jgi:hypothetical protein
VFGLARPRLEAELVDLVECLAVATGRSCEWYGGSFVGEHSMHQQSSWLPRFATRITSVDKADSHVAILHEPDAAHHARRLCDAMYRKLAQRGDVSLPTTVDAMRQALEALVTSSPYVLLLQTASVLSQPWALLAAYWAALARLPIICVVVNDSGYDFGGAKEHLEHLSERLDAASLQQLTAVLSQLAQPHSRRRRSSGIATPGCAGGPRRTSSVLSVLARSNLARSHTRGRSVTHDVEAVQKRLASTIPHIISVVYDPEGGKNQLAATVRDICDKQRLLAKSGSPRRHSQKAMNKLRFSSTPSILDVRVEDVTAECSARE